MTVATTRDVDRRVIAGVCAGLASRYRYPVTGVRAATVAFSVATAGLGGLAYLALWRYLPPGEDGAPPTHQSDASAGRATATFGAIDRPADVASTALTQRATGRVELAHAADAPRVAEETRRGGVPVVDDPAAVLYGPVAADLPLVRERMLSIARSVEFEFLQRMLDQALSGSGKLMRPAVALLSGRLGSYELDRLVPLAASVELLHTATLVHDDVIDEAAERRGKPTSAALFGNSASVMLGDYMFAHAADFIAQTDNTLVVRKFAATLMQMANGELTQDVTAFEYSEDVQRYLDRIIGKTASLFATAAEGGAMVGGVPSEQVEAMRLYGLRLGIAFQIVDDILDFTGDPDVMGKPVGSDLRSGTLTLPAILYMQQRPADNPIKRAFEGVRQNANFERAIAEIRESDVLDESRRTAERFADEARLALEALPAGEVRDTLAGLVDYVLERKS